MNFFTAIIRKTGYLLSFLALSIFISSCGSYKEPVKDGIYSSESDTVVVSESEVNKTAASNATDNYFKRELDKYESLQNDEEIILNADDYSSDTDQENYEDEYETNSSWGDDTDGTNVTYHINNYGWYHPYHSYGHYGFNYGYPRYRHYRYNPYSYGYNSWYGYGGYYNNYYGGYYNNYYGGYYNNYYNNYGYYNGGYYGGYGYDGYDGYYAHTTPSNYQYGRRTTSNTSIGRRNRASLSRSIVSSTNTNKRSIIRGSGDISKQLNRRASKPTSTSVRTRTTTHPRKAVKRNTSTPTRKTSTNTRQNTPTRKARSTTPTKRAKSRTSNNTTRTRSTSSGSSSRSSTSRGSSSSSSGSSKGSSGSSSSGRRR